MDERQVLEQHEEISDVAGAADAAAGALAQLLARELPLPVRHQLRIALGGVETRAPQYEFRSFTIVNRSAQTLYVAATPGDAERARAGEGGVAIEIPPTSIVTEPIAGRELYVAGTGAGTEAVILYRWAHVLPPSLYSTGTVALGGVIDANVLTAPRDEPGADNSVATEDIRYADGITRLIEVKFAPIDQATLGDGTVVAAVPTRKLRVLSYDLIAAGTVTALWKSAAAAISGPKALSLSTGVSKSHSKGVLETAAGAALVLNLSAAVAVGGELSYIEV